MYKVLTILQTTNYVDIKVSTVMVVIPQGRGACNALGLKICLATDHPRPVLTNRCL